MIKEFKNFEGVKINVDLDTVDAVGEQVKGAAVLVIGTVEVVVKGDAEKVAASIGAARGRECSYLKPKEKRGSGAPVPPKVEPPKVEPQKTPMPGADPGDLPPWEGEEKGSMGT